MHQWIKHNQLSYVLVFREVLSALEGGKAAFTSKGAAVMGSFEDAPREHEYLGSFIEMHKFARQNTKDVPRQSLLFSSVPNLLYTCFRFAAMISTES